MLNVYQELADPSRRAILGELRTGPKNVTSVVNATGLKQPNVSNHLARLRERGVVTSTKAGREVYYALATPDIEKAVRTVFSAASDEPFEIDVAALAKTYARAAVQGETQICMQVLEILYRKRMPLLDIYQDVLTPAMTMVGTWYDVGAIDEAQEHVASEITLRLMSTTTNLVGPSGTSQGMALLGCSAGNYHTLGLRMIADYLSVTGWRVVFMGANVPSQAFVTAAKEHAPDLVMVSCTNPSAIDETLALVKALKEVRPPKSGYLLGVGGQAVLPLYARFKAAGADFTAPDLKALATELLPGLTKGAAGRN